MDQTQSWADIKPGSIYNALHRMQHEGLVEVIAMEQQSGPTRAVFGLTDEGRAALDVQLRQALTAASLPADPFDIAARLADDVETDELTKLLNERRGALESSAEDREATLHEVRRFLTAWDVVAFEHVIAKLRFEADWMTKILARLGTSAEEKP